MKEPKNTKEMFDYHQGDHSTLLEMINTLAHYMGVYLQPVIKDGEVTYEVKPIKDK